MNFQKIALWVHSYILEEYFGMIEINFHCPQLIKILNYYQFAMKNDFVYCKYRDLICLAVSITL